MQRRSLERSNRHFERALRSLPLGVTSNFRYWGPEKTIYIKQGKGPYLWDLDDNRYIDYRLGYGPAILGYADPRVDAAAREGMDIGGVFALATEREASVAERIQKMVPAAERVRFSNSWKTRTTPKLLEGTTGWSAPSGAGSFRLSASAWATSCSANS